MNKTLKLFLLGIACLFMVILCMPNQVSAAVTVDDQADLVAALNGTESVIEISKNITLTSTVEYYYSNSSVNYDKKDYNSLKKQTRYTTKFVYVYDETKFKYNQKAFSINCPNCGAPLLKLGEGNCSYCGTYIKPINLKNWYMISYKDDYE